MTSWIGKLRAGVTESERELVERYTRRLLAQAQRQLPERLRRRIDPEDIVQSVYRSFFRRLNDGQFKFDDSHDVWRLLSVMTYHKVLNTVKHHQQCRRDVRRESSVLDADIGQDRQDPMGGRTPGPEDIAVLFDCLEQLLRELPENYRQIVRLRLEGASIADIAGKVSRSRRTVLRVLANVQHSAVSQLEQPA